MFRESHEASDASKWDEVWEGVLHVPPLPNDEHQDLVYGLGIPLREVVQSPGLGKVRPGVNVTDRHPNWKFNFRGPDVVVYLNSNPAINHETHWTGGPDFLIEIISPGEDPYAKLDFYAKVHTREVLIVHRQPWTLELFQLKGDTFSAVGRSDLMQPTDLPSSTLPFSFRLVPGPGRPLIELKHTVTAKTWTA